MAFGGCRVWAKCYTGFKENQDDVMERVTLVGSVPSLRQATASSPTEPCGWHCYDDLRPKAQNNEATFPRPR